MLLELIEDRGARASNNVPLKKKKIHSLSIGVVSFPIAGRREVARVFGCKFFEILTLPVKIGSARTIVRYCTIYDTYTIIYIDNAYNRIRIRTTYT